MFLLEASTSTQNIRWDIIDSSLKLSSSSLGNSFHIIFWNSTSTENSSIGKPLSGQISNWEFWQYNIGSSVFNFLEFFINNLPFSIDNTLEIINIFNSNFCVLFFWFKFELYFQDDNFWICETFWLLFKTSIWESFLESDSTNKEWIIDWSTSYFFNTDQVLIKKVWIELLYCGNDDFCEKVFIWWKKFWVKCSLSTFNKHVSSFLWSIVELNDKVFKLFKAPLKSLFISSDQNLRIHTVFDKSFCVFH